MQSAMQSATQSAAQSAVNSSAQYWPAGTPPRRQRGLSLPRLLLAMVLLIFGGNILLLTVPVYLNNDKIESAVRRVAAQSDIRAVSKGEIASRIKRYLDVDYAHGTVDINKSLKMKRSRDKLQLQVDYETVVPLFANVSLLLKFENHIDAAKK